MRTGSRNWKKDFFCDRANSSALSVLSARTIRIELISDEALKTSEIEGELLNRDSVQSSLRQQLGIGSEAQRIPPRERGISEMMVDLYRSFDKPLAQDALCLA